MAAFNAPCLIPDYNAYPIKRVWFTIRARTYFQAILHVATGRKEEPRRAGGTYACSYFDVVMAGDDMKESHLLGECIRYDVTLTIPSVTQ
jgi:hypothetical protein